MSRCNLIFILLTIDNQYLIVRLCKFAISNPELFLSPLLIEGGDYGVPTFQSASKEFPIESAKNSNQLHQKDLFLSTTSSAV
jgi:hypothetical protein